MLVTLLGLAGVGDVGARVRATTLRVCPGAFATIQAAIDDASAGDTIEICAGVHHEQVTIDKDVTLVDTSSTRQAVIEAPPTMTSNSFGACTVVEVGGGANVTIRGLTIKGPGAPHCSANRLLGVLVVGGASLTLTDDLITDMNFGQAHFGLQQVAAVLAGSGGGVSGEVGHLTAIGDRLIGYQKAAMVIGGSGSTGQIRDNTVVGIGPTTLTAQNGIQVSTGASADVVGNFVDDNLYTPADALAAGILLFSAGQVTVAHNDLLRNDANISLASQSTPATIEHNTISGGNWGVLLNPARDAHILDNTSIGANVGFALFGSPANTLSRNSAAGAGSNGADCVDGTMGSESAGTANTWNDNIGGSAEPSAICSHGPITTIALHPRVPDGPGGAFSGSVRVVVSALRAGGSSVTTTRCALDPHTPPTHFQDLPAGHCPYLGAGADVTHGGRHTVYAMSIDAAGITDTTMRSTSFTVTQSPLPQPPPPGPDLSLTKTASSDTVHPGDQLTYQLVATNHGPGDAAAVTVQDHAPPGVSFQHAQPSQGSCTITGGVLTCMHGALHSGGDALVQVTATVAAHASGTIHNSASVWSNRDDPHGANNTATSSVHVAAPGTPGTGPGMPGTGPGTGMPGPGPGAPGSQPVSDLRLELHGPQGHVLAGVHHTFTITLTNHGPDPAEHVVVTFTASLPLRILTSALISSAEVADTASAHAAADVSCTSTLPVRCELGTVPVGATTTLRIVAVPLVSGLLRASASVMSASLDPHPTSTVVTVTTPIASAPPRRPAPPRPRPPSSPPGRPAPPPRVTG